MADSYDPARLDDAVRQIRAVVFDVAAEWAVAVQGRMRSNASWVDRNGPSMTGKNARQSLEAEAGRALNGDVIVVARADRQTLRPWSSWPGAPVSVFLELGTRFMARRDVIRPTVHEMAPTLGMLLQMALRGEMP